MQNPDLLVISQLREWLQQNKRCWLCTVINTWGSAPRLPGSLLACNEEGQTAGSLSGGCVEEDLIEQLCNGSIAAQKALYKIYGETEQEAERFQLPCGGTLGVLIEPMSANDLINVQSIEQSLMQRQSIFRSYDWTTHHTEVRTCDRPPGIHFEHDQHQPLKLHQVYGPQTHLFLIGVSEVSRALAHFALACDFRVTVCDPRPEMASQWGVEHTLVLTAMPDDAVREYANDRNSAIVALTHDPRIDDMGLMDAFDTDAFYIGAMGSQATSQKRRQRLQQLGVSAEQLERLHAPVGLDIRSKTPSEIAVAIVAQLVAERARYRKHF